MLKRALRFLNEYCRNNPGIVAVVGIVVSVIATSIPPIPRVFRVLVFVPTGWFAYMSLRSLAYRIVLRARRDFVHGKIFPGLFSVGEGATALPTTLFDRSDELERLGKAIMETRQADRILAVTGPSGVGKSVLTGLLEARLQQRSDECKVRLVRFNDPLKSDAAVLREARQFVESHASILDASDAAMKVIVLLDQFEVCLDRITTVYMKKGKRMHSLRDFLSDAGQHPDPLVRELGALLTLKKQWTELRIAIVLRSDRYYDLRMLGTYGQIPYDAFEVLGLSETAGANTLMEALTEINAEPRDVEEIVEDLKEEDGTILPVKAQMVGCMLEYAVFYPTFRWIRKLFKGSEERLLRARARADRKLFNASGKAEGLIEEYFRLAISSATDPSVAREVMFALAIEGRVRRRYTLKELGEITFREEAELGNVLQHLENAGLLSASHDGYAYVHDYLAKQYLQLSGRLIEPIVRDNIAYSHTTFMAGRERMASAKDDEQDRQALKVWLTAVKIAMLTYFGYRLSEFLWFEPLWKGAAHVTGGFTAYTVGPSWRIDWHYLPILLVQCGWGFYVVDLVKNVFGRIDHERRMRWGSLTMVGVVVLGMVVTSVVPGAWLISVAANGVLVGLKFWCLGTRIRQSTGGSNDYRIIGFYTLVNCFFVAWIAVFKIPHMAWDLPQFASTSFLSLVGALALLRPVSEFSAIYYLIVPLLTYFVYMYSAHTVPRRAVQFIGLYKRVEAARGSGG